MIFIVGPRNSIPDDLKSASAGLRSQYTCRSKLSMPRAFVSRPTSLQLNTVQGHCKLHPPWFHELEGRTDIRTSIRKENASHMYPFLNKLELYIRKESEDTMSHDLSRHLFPLIMAVNHPQRAVYEGDNYCFPYISGITPLRKQRNLATKPHHSQATRPKPSRVNSGRL